MSLEKITNPQHVRHWLGDMEADYVYTLGVAGEHFFKEIKENERIMAAKCPRCNIAYLPPRLYCERCFEKLKEWIDVGIRGEIYTYTVVYYNEDGEKLKDPVIYAFIKFEKAYGGIIHKLGETSPEDVEIGMPVTAVFKPKNERKGSINDIKYFKPLK